MQQDGDETIRVLTVLGKSYTIDHSKVHTLADLKGELFSLSGIEQEQQQIIINGTLCKDPQALLCTFGANPVYILAEKIDDEQQEPQDYSQQARLPMAASYWQKNSMDYEHNYKNGQSCQNHNFRYLLVQPFLTRQQEAAYRKEVQNSYSKQIVHNLRKVIAGVDEDLAIRAVRACCNDLSEAIDFVELEKRGENYYFDIEDKIPHYPNHEQPYLVAYIQQQLLKDKIARSREVYAWFVASMKEKSPTLYEMLLRNRNFMEKWLFWTENQAWNQHQHNQYAPSAKISNMQRQGNLAMKPSQGQMAQIIDKLAKMGYYGKDVKLSMIYYGPNIQGSYRHLASNHHNYDQNIIKRGSNKNSSKQFDPRYYYDYQSQHQ